VIRIEANKPGRLWLIAMFKLYCKKHDCTWVAYPDGKFEAIGDGAKKVHYEFEIATGRLLIKCVNAVATEQGAKNTIIHNTIRNYVKALYKEQQADV
jgi:hypothetical protein